MKCIDADAANLDLSYFLIRPKSYSVHFLRIDENLPSAKTLSRFCGQLRDERTSLLFLCGEIASSRFGICRLLHFFKLFSCSLVNRILINSCASTLKAALQIGYASLHFFFSCRFFLQPSLDFLLHLHLCSVFRFLLFSFKLLELRFQFGFFCFLICFFFRQSFDFGLLRIFLLHGLFPVFLNLAPKFRFFFGLRLFFGFLLQNVFLLLLFFSNFLQQFIAFLVCLVFFGLCLL
mmetsp:Transcript_39994/g.63504  ORF Transcript_39994/g.63504 Transcript_39994/m.63504 type:complete len:234 (-) Transcript_39994:865-1566(-)